MNLSASIFKAYDIRGVVPATIDEAVAEALGRAFGTVALREGEKTVAVGRDGRLSGPGLSNALIRGLLTAGVDVIDVGKVTTYTVTGLDDNATYHFALTAYSGSEESGYSAIVTVKPAAASTTAPAPQLLQIKVY